MPCFGPWPRQPGVCKRSDGHSQKPGISPIEDQAILAALCGTCHDVGNVAVSKQTDGSYGHNAIGEESPSHVPAQQFPLKRTYSEWMLSAFAVAPGIDMGGRFGGTRGPVVSSCQDCHMPDDVGKACNDFYCEERSDLAVHAFAAAGAPVVGITYADGQYSHTQRHAIPTSTDHIEAALWYQSLPRAYIEALRDGDPTGTSPGEILLTLWEQTGKGAPIPMATASMGLGEHVFANGFEAGAQNPRPSVPMVP